ncbi:hypothetical protein [Terriglobus roseus]|nr:hypothetical protein [Terriglobus roseus]
MDIVAQSSYNQITGPRNEDHPTWHDLPSIEWQDGSWYATASGNEARIILGEHDGAKDCQSFGCVGEAPRHSRTFLSHAVTGKYVLYQFLDNPPGGPVVTINTEEKWIRIGRNDRQRQPLTDELKTQYKYLLDEGEKILQEAARQYAEKSFKVAIANPLPATHTVTKAGPAPNNPPMTKAASNPPVRGTADRETQIQTNSEPPAMAASNGAVHWLKKDVDDFRLGPTTTLTAASSVGGGFNLTAKCLVYKKQFLAMGTISVSGIPIEIQLLNPRVQYALYDEPGSIDAKITPFFGTANVTGTVTQGHKASEAWIRIDTNPAKKNGYGDSRKIVVAFPGMPQFDDPTMQKNYEKSRKDLGELGSFFDPLTQANQTLYFLPDLEKASTLRIQLSLTDGNQPILSADLNDPILREFVLDCSTRKDKATRDAEMKAALDREAAEKAKEAEREAAVKAKQAELQKRQAQAFFRGTAADFDKRLPQAVAAAIQREGITGYDYSKETSKLIKIMNACEAPPDNPDKSKLRNISDLSNGIVPNGQMHMRVNINAHNVDYDKRDQDQRKYFEKKGIIHPEEKVQCEFTVDFGYNLILTGRIEKR